MDSGLALRAPGNDEALAAGLFSRNFGREAHVFL
jgi:hypothetical protein